MTPTRLEYQFLPVGDPNANKFEIFKESVEAEIKAVHSKFHSTMSSAPEIDQIVAKNRTNSLHYENN